MNKSPENKNSPETVDFRDFQAVDLLDNLRERKGLPPMSDEQRESMAGFTAGELLDTLAARKHARNSAQKPETSRKPQEIGSFQGQKPAEKQNSARKHNKSEKKETPWWKPTTRKAVALVALTAVGMMGYANFHRPIERQIATSVANKKNPVKTPESQKIDIQNSEKSAENVSLAPTFDFTKSQPGENVGRMEIAQAQPGWNIYGGKNIVESPDDISDARFINDSIYGNWWSSSGQNSTEGAINNIEHLRGTGNLGANQLSVFAGHDGVGGQFEDFSNGNVKMGDTVKMTMKNGVTYTITLSADFVTNNKGQIYANEDGSLYKTPTENISENQIPRKLSNLNVLSSSEEDLAKVGLGGPEVAFQTCFSNGNTLYNLDESGNYSQGSNGYAKHYMFGKITEKSFTDSSGNQVVEKIAADGSLQK